MKSYIVMLSIQLVLAVVIITQTGCFQVLGIDEMDAWGFKVKGNSGFNVNAGIMQYDHALDRKGKNVEARDNRKLEKY